MNMIPQPFFFAGGMPERTVTISGSSVLAGNLSAWVLANSDWDGVTVEELTVTITGSAWSNNSSIPALTVDTGFPVESEIILVVAPGALICGNGAGSGGALKVERACTIDNQGSINGGGYNAGGSAGTTGPCRCVNCDTDCGSCLAQNGTGTSGGTGYGYGNSSAGSAKTNGAAGSSAANYACPYGCAKPVSVNYSSCPGGAGGVGGDAGSGYSVSGDAFVSWTNTGSRAGSVS